MKRIIFILNSLFILLLFNGSLHAQVQNITVTNKTGMKVSEVYIATAGQENWHLLRNTRNGLTKDETFTIRQSIHKVYCNFDLKFLCEDGNFYYMRDLDMCNDSSFLLKLPDDK